MSPTPSPRPAKIALALSLGSARVEATASSETAQTRKANHPRPRLMDTSTPRPRLVLVLRVEGNIKNLAVISPHFINISLPEAFLDRACVWRRRFRGPRGVSLGSSPREEAAGGLETLPAPTRSECTQNRRRNHAHGREMATSHIDKVKAPRRLTTRRAHRPART